jgi:protein SCO1/2
MAGLALLALAGCERRGEAVPFESIDVSGADWGRDFRLLGSDGRTVQLADFQGRCVLLFFGFTQCPDVCPTALSRAAAVMQRLGAQATKLQVIFVTADPERDTPAVLREYTRAFHPSFIGLNADLATTEATAKTFKVFYRKVPTGSSYTMDHTATSYVFDPTGRLRLAVRHEQDATSLAADITRLLKESA